MGTELEEAAVDYSMALTEINYSSSRGTRDAQAPLRLRAGADQNALDAVLRNKAQRFTTLLDAESNPGQVKEVAFRNMNSLELRNVLVPLLEKYLDLCGPDILLYLLIGNLYWSYGDDDQASKYFAMAARLDPGNLYVLRQQMLQASTTEDQVLASRRILERYPEDPVALDTLERIEAGVEPHLSPHAEEHSSIDFVLSRLDCTPRDTDPPRDESLLQP
jgi:tetratricopeptide (TPR) repeat protein